jgi:nicotinate phosphoribosyltransferase
LRDAQILASGNLDEYRIGDLVQSRAPIDSFAVGTAMTTSADAPSLDCAYKLQEYAGRPCRKRSEGKATWPGRKQVYRLYGPDGMLAYDVVTTLEDQQDGEALLQPVIKEGRSIAPSPKLSELRQRVAAQLARIPGTMRTLKTGTPYEVRFASSLQKLARAVDETI